MMRPRLLLLDEPSLGLAPKIVREIFELLLQINARDGVAILVADKTRSRAFLVIARLRARTGRVAVEGRSADLVDDDRIRRSYLGYQK